ncbi:MAG: threonine synthase, partial [Acidimicrobiia bacterium]|nr:threonine synthase [Acidimicrobiia bacterium]
YEEGEIEEAIAALYRSSGEILDPHTAIGWMAGTKETAERRPMVTVATAHPAKFPEAVERATGIRPLLPDDLSDLGERPERIRTIAPDIDAVSNVLADLAG